MDNIFMSDQDLSNAVEQKAIESFGKHLDRFINSSEKYIDLKLKKKWFSFEHYLEKMYKRCAITTVMIDREKPYNLEDIYVSGKYKYSNEILTDEDILAELLCEGRLSVQGLGGAGKTILLKYFWLKIFQSEKGKIPIFVELRRLNDFQDRQLNTYIRTLLSPPQAVMSDVIFKEFCADGTFVFLLDGFDELHEDARQNIQSQILDLSFNYPKCSILVSSRLDERFVSWEQFKIVKACAFDKEQVLSIVDNIDFQKTVKKKFITDVIESRYEKFSEFLATPLLTLMMLFTYGQFGDVPEKIHIFYRYAFQTLYSLHDGSKEAFTRERKTGLNEEDFAKIFSYFCLLTYSEAAFSFSEDKILEYINDAK